MNRIIALVCALTLTGCLNGRSGPGQLTRSRLQFEKTKDVESLDLDSHKDVSVDEVERIAPDGSTVKIKGYKSRANEGAIVASTEQAKSAAAVAQSNVDMFKLALSLAAQVYSGGMVKPQPQVVYVTNFVTAPTPAGTVPAGK